MMAGNWCSYCVAAFPIDWASCPGCGRPVGWQEANRGTTLLQERGTTHGDYTHMAITIQKIKDAMRAGEGWARCNAGQREALELIATKIGRIVCGDPGHHDHWADLIGYATKALERIGVPK